MRVPPKNLCSDIREAVRTSLAEKYENRILRDHGVILAVMEVSGVGEGKILVEDPGVHYTAKFIALVYQPRLHEVVEGQVVDITNFGVFVRIGPLDGLCHVSQVINDFVSFDRKTGVLSARDTKRTMKVGDAVRSRIIAISLEKKEVNKINLTMRQPGLGKPEWILEDKEGRKPKPSSGGPKRKPQTEGKG